MRLSTHLGFTGQCEEAFKLYEKTLGGKIQMMMTYGNSPMADQFPADFHNKIMHVSMLVDGQVLMGADAPPGRGAKPQGFTVAISVSDTSQAERIFNTLAEGGQVQMPLQQTFWAKKFGMLIDRFGTPWMVNAGENQ